MSASAFRAFRTESLLQSDKILWENMCKTFLTYSHISKFLNVYLRGQFTNRLLFCRLTVRWGGMNLIGGSLGRNWFINWRALSAEPLAVFFSYCLLSNLITRGLSRFGQVSKTVQNAAIYTQPNKYFKVMTFRRGGGGGGFLKYTIECKYLSEALETFCHH